MNTPKVRSSSVYLYQKMSEKKISQTFDDLAEYDITHSNPYHNVMVVFYAFMVIVDTEFRNHFSTR